MSNTIYQCKICNEKFNDIKLLGRHIHYHHKEISKKQYYDEYLGNDRKCCVCENESTFLNLSKGYTLTCGPSCRTKIQWLNDSERKKKLSQQMTGNNFSQGRPKGSKNKNPYPMTEAVWDRLKKNPPKDWSGCKHTIKTRRKMSETRLDKIKSGEITIMASYKGKFKPNNPKKYKGDHTNIIYRSSWELRFMQFLDEHKDVIRWSSEELRIPYRDITSGKMRTYFPDFWVEKIDRNGKKGVTVVEIKPFKETQEPRPQKKLTKGYLYEVKTWGINKSKWKAAESYCTDRGWNFMIATEKDLGIKY